MTLQIGCQLEKIIIKIRVYRIKNRDLQTKSRKFLQRDTKTNRNTCVNIIDKIIGRDDQDSRRLLKGQEPQRVTN